MLKNLQYTLPVTLASLKEGGRDGTLVVISPDHQTYARTPIATLQSALDTWRTGLPILHKLSEDLRKTPGTPLPPFHYFHSPLPRAYQWIDGSAYVNHVELVRKARGAAMPESFWTDPLMYQGASDSFIGPHDPIDVADENYGIDMEGEVAIITNDVPMGISPEKAAEHIQLVMLVNDVSLRQLIPNELAKGFGFLHGKPATAFSPFAVTPAVLGQAWRNHKVHLPLNVSIKRAGQTKHTLIGSPNAGVDMTFDFATLIAHGAKTRHLSAGTIVGSGTISNIDRTQGSCCLAEVRMLETLENGSAKTLFLKFGDTVRIEMGDIFGTIEQVVRQYRPHLRHND